MTTQIVLPFTEEQAQACASAAQAFGVESWEIGVHVLAEKQRWELRKQLERRKKR